MKSLLWQVQIPEVMLYLRLLGLAAAMFALHACELMSPERNGDFRFELSATRIDTEGIIEGQLFNASGERWDLIYHCGSLFLLEWWEDGAWTRGNAGDMVQICPAVYARPFRSGDTVRFSFDLTRFEAGAGAYRVVAVVELPRDRTSRRKLISRSFIRQEPDVLP